MTDAIPIKQLDGSTYQGVNCGCAVGAMQVEQATDNRARPTPAQFRSHVKNANGTQDRDAIGSSQIRDVLVGTYGLKAELRFGIPFADLDDLGDRGFSLAIDYSPLVGTKHDCFRGKFGGDHFLFVPRRNPDGTWKVADPGADGRYAGCPTGYQSMSNALVQKAAGMHAVTINGKVTTVAARYGPGHAVVVIGQVPVPTIPKPEESAVRITATVYQHWTAVGSNGVLRATPSRTAPITERLPAGTVVTSRAEADDPAGNSWRLIDWPAGSRTPRWLLHYGPGIPRGHDFLAGEIVPDPVP